MKKVFLKIFKIGFFLVSLILFIHLLYSLLSLMEESNLNDFQVYYQAAKISLSENPYKKEYFSPYNYPPTATLFLLPLTLLPYKLAEFLWLMLSFFSLLFSVFLTFNLFFKRTSFVLKFFVSTLLLRTFPARFTLVLGQINLIILLLLVLSFHFYQKKRKILAGFFLGFAGAIKLTPLLLLLFYFLKKEKKTVIASLLTFLSSNLLAFIIFGPQQLLYFFKEILPLLLKQADSRGMTTTNINQSLEVFLFRLSLTGIFGNLIKWFFVFFSLFLVARKIIFKNQPLENFKSFSALLLVTTVFIPGFAWQHHFVFLFPALLILVFWLLKKPNFLKGLPVAFFLFSFYFHFKDLNSPFLQNPFSMSHNFLSAVVLLIALLVI